MIVVIAPILQARHVCVRQKTAGTECGHHGGQSQQQGYRLPLNKVQHFSGLGSRTTLGLPKRIPVNQSTISSPTILRWLWPLLFPV